MTTMTAPATSTPLSPGHLLELIALGALWGGSFLFMRIAAPEFGPIALIALRVTLAALLMLPLLLHASARLAWRANWWPIAVVGIFNSALPFCLFAYATLALPAGFTAVLNASAALWGALLGWSFLGQKVQARTALGLALGLGGVVVMVWNKLATDVGTNAPALAIAAAVLATALYALCAHYTRRRLAGVSPLVVAAGSQVWAALVLLLPGWWLWPALPPSPTAWAAAIALGVFSTAVAYVLYFRLIANIGASRAMTVTLLVPLFGVVLGAVVLGEGMSFTSAIGAAAVLAGTGLALGLRRMQQ